MGLEARVHQDPAGHVSGLDAFAQAGAADVLARQPRRLARDVPPGRADEADRDPLQVRRGGRDALHRDLFGDLVLPLRAVVRLSDPRRERTAPHRTGGEFLLLEQRPRAQSRGSAFLVPQGHGYAFTTQDRPVRSRRGWSAAPVRHGVSAVRSGERYPRPSSSTTPP
nr:2OG-Fe(II) oxygenase [Streptomyces tropicalis]